MENICGNEVKFFFEEKKCVFLEEKFNFKLKILTEKE